MGAVIIILRVCYNKLFIVYECLIFEQGKLIFFFLLNIIIVVTVNAQPKPLVLETYNLEGVFQLGCN